MLDPGYMGVEGVKTMVHVPANGAKLLDLVMLKGRMRSDFNTKILDEHADILRLSRGNHIGRKEYQVLGGGADVFTCILVM